MLLNRSLIEKMFDSESLQIPVPEALKNYFSSTIIFVKNFDVDLVHIGDIDPKLPSDGHIIRNKNMVITLDGLIIKNRYGTNQIKMSQHQLSEFNKLLTKIKLLQMSDDYLEYKNENN